MKRILHIVWVLCLTSVVLVGQNCAPIEVAVGFNQGRILRHSPKFTFQLPKRSQGFEISTRFQTTGKQAWQHWLGYPAIGLKFNYYNFGDAAVLGNAFGMYPFLSFYLIRKSPIQLKAGFGTGAAWLDRPYDRIYNPTNNAIGSKLNNITAFHSELLLKVHRDWRMVLGGSFTHFSNGASIKPNLGINIPAWHIGLQYAPNPVNRQTYQQWPNRKPLRRLGLSLQYQMAFKESTVPGGPLTPVYNGSMAGLIRLSKVNHLHVGFDWEYHRSIYDFGLHTFTFYTKDDARKGATRWGIFVSEELLFGNFGLYIQLGLYLSPDSLLKPWFLYNRLGIRYHLPPVGKPSTRFYGGIYLKSHKAAAEFVALGLGASF